MITASTALMAQLAEEFEQLRLLLGAEPLDTAVVGDLDVLHDLAGLDLADAGQRLEQGDDLELADVDVVGGQRVGQCHRAHLEPGLDLGACGAGLCGLCQCRRSLFGGQLRGCCHDGQAIAVISARLVNPLLTAHATSSSCTRRVARGSANDAVPTCTADAPASISSTASHPDRHTTDSDDRHIGERPVHVVHGTHRHRMDGAPGQPAAAGAQRRRRASRGRRRARATC